MLQNGASEVEPGVMDCAGDPLEDSVTKGETTETERFQQMLLTWFTEIVGTYGGARQYLNSAYDTTDKMQGYVASLMQLVPFQDDTCYSTTVDMPGLKESEFGQHVPRCGHPALFGWHQETSIKGDPEVKLTLKLAEQIMQDGFRTSDEPVRVRECLALICRSLAWSSSLHSLEAYLRCTPLRNVVFTCSMCVQLQSVLKSQL